MNQTRVLIDIPIIKTIPQHVKYENEFGLLIHKKVHFEWKLVHHDQCGGCGYHGVDCAKRTSIMRQRPRTQPNPIQNEAPQPEIETENAQTYTM